MLPLIDVRSFFFFKQKTAYEMRISDWSSDVCSSDLRLTIVGKNLRDHIDFVIETFWEQRADGTVDQAAGQRFLFSRAAFPLEKAARNASGGREFFLIMNGTGEKVLPFLHGFGGRDCPQPHGFPIGRHHSPARPPGTP